MEGAKAWSYYALRCIPVCIRVSETAAIKTWLQLFCHFIISEKERACVASKTGPLIMF